MIYIYILYLYYSIVNLYIYSIYTNIYTIHIFIKIYVVLMKYVVASPSGTRVIVLPFRKGTMNTKLVDVMDTLHITLRI